MYNFCDNFMVLLYPFYSLQVPIHLHGKEQNVFAFNRRKEVILEMTCGGRVNVELSLLSVVIF